MQLGRSVERSAARIERRAITTSSLWVWTSYVAVALVAAVPRLIDLGTFVTFDEISFWFDRCATFLRAMRTGDYGATVITAHPGVTTMWLGATGIVLRRTLFDWGWLQHETFPLILTFMRLPMATLHIAGVLVGYALLRRMLDARVALVAALLWATDPFVLAYSRVLHVDGPAMTLMTLSLLAACCYWTHKGARAFLLLSAVCAGLAIISKSPSVLVAPVVGVVALATLRAPDGTLRFRPVVLSLLVWGVVCIITICAFWPAIWVDPYSVYVQLQSGVTVEGAEPHQQGNFFLGRADDAPGLLFYPAALALRLTPWAMAGLFLLPVAWWRAQRLGATRRDLATLAGFALLFLVAMSVFPKKFNRYLVPIFPSLDVLAAVGLVWGADVVGAGVVRLRRGWARWAPRIAALPLVALVALASFTALRWNPYQIAYFNPLLGGAQRGADTFMVGWGEGFEQVAAWLNQQPDITGVTVVTPIALPLQPYLRPGAQAVVEDRLGKDAGYVVAYVRYVQGRIWPPYDQFVGRVPPLHVVRVHGVEYAWIYQAPPPVEQERPALFGSDIRLRGLTTTASPARGQPLSYRLHWYAETQPTKDAMLFAHVIGPNGERVAQIDLPLGATSWQAARYTASDVPLQLPADAPAGTYRVVVGLYNLDTGARYPLADATPADPALDGPDALVLDEWTLP
jgi:4-amino-4-deoxy-L-arabinose transferase-like glycosyltransferase